MRRKFNDDLRRKIVEEIESGSLTLSAASRKYDVPVGALQFWRVKFSQDSSGRNSIVSKAQEKSSLRQKFMLLTLILYVAGVFFTVGYAIFSKSQSAGFYSNVRHLGAGTAMIGFISYALWESPRSLSSLLPLFLRFFYSVFFRGRF